MAKFLSSKTRLQVVLLGLRYFQKKNPKSHRCQLLRDTRAKFWRFCAFPQNSILAPDGRRDFVLGAKLPQWPRLYMLYEALYALKRLFFEKIAENWFSSNVQPKISFLRFSRKVSILEQIVLCTRYINVAIAVIFRQKRSLYNFQGRSYEISKWSKPLKSKWRWVWS